MKINLFNLFNLRNEKEEFEVVADRIKKNADTQGTYLWILFFAILIASLGLNINSTAVIIGAMLISPLIGPIVGLGFGAAINDLALIKTALTNYAFSTVVGLSASSIFFLITPIDTAQSEIISRTFPSLYDVAIALFGGVAGIIAMSSKQKGNVIPGVAIATAIMPPLCTAGYGLATGQWNFFFGAFYLYIINSVFIFAATVVTTRLLKFPARKYTDPQLKKKEQRIIWSIIIITLMPSFYLSYDLVQNQKFTDKAETFIAAEANFENDYLLKKEIIPQKKSIILTYGGKEITQEEIEHVKSKLKYYELADANLEILFGFSFSTDDKNKEQLNQVGQALNQSSKENKNLKTRLDSVSKQNELNTQLVKELKILYPDLKEAIIQPVTMYKDSNNLKQATYLVFLKREKKLKKNERLKLQEWLEERTGRKDVTLIENTEK